LRLSGTFSLSIVTLWLNVTLRLNIVLRLNIALRLSITLKINIALGAYPSNSVLLFINSATLLAI